MSHFENVLDEDLADTIISLLSGPPETTDKDAPSTAQHEKEMELSLQVEKQPQVRSMTRETTMIHAVSSHPPLTSSTGTSFAVPTRGGEGDGKKKRDEEIPTGPLGFRFPLKKKPRSQPLQPQMNGPISLEPEDVRGEASPSASRNAIDIAKHHNEPTSNSVRPTDPHCHGQVTNHGSIWHKKEKKRISRFRHDSRHHGLGNFKGQFSPEGRTRSKNKRHEAKKAEKLNDKHDVARAHDGVPKVYCGSGKTTSQGFKVGDLVEGYWPLEDKWFPGKISSCNGDKYYITYDDGDEQEDVISDMIRPMLPTRTMSKYDEANKGKVETARNDSILGRKLSTKWDMDGGGYEWYKGTIVQMEDEHVVVHYEEDGSNHQVPYPSANSKLVEEGEGEEEEEKTDSKLVNGREETRISLGTFVSYCDNEAKTYHGSKVQRKFAPEHAVRWPRGKLQKMTAAGTGTKALWGRLDEDDSSVADGDTSPLSPLSSDDDDDAMQGVGRGCTTGGVDSDAAAVATDMKRTPPY
jgi:hypothetical protein